MTDQYCYPAREVWCSNTDVWRFVLVRYVPILAALNLLWEVAQLPLYTLWFEAPPTYIAFAVFHCTVGDILIGTGALLSALIVTRARTLRDWRWTRIGVVSIALGLAYTTVSEWMNTAISAGWTYSEWMPVLPFVPIGLSPLLQWLIVPTAALALSRKFTFRHPTPHEATLNLGDLS